MITTLATYNTGYNHIYLYRNESDFTDITVANTGQIIEVNEELIAIGIWAGIYCEVYYD